MKQKKEDKDDGTLATEPEDGEVTRYTIFYELFGTHPFAEILVVLFAPELGGCTK